MKMLTNVKCGAVSLVLPDNEITYCIIGISGGVKKQYLGVLVFRYHDVNTDWLNHQTLVSHDQTTVSGSERVQIVIQWH